MCRTFGHLLTPVTCQSDHPVMNSRYLLYEAQNAYYYGLPENLAIASVTSTPAKLLGLGHRVGYVKEGERELFVQRGDNFF